MSKKIFCDLCGREMKPVFRFNDHIYSVTINGAYIEPDIIDLCRNCIVLIIQLGSHKIAEKEYEERK